MMNRIMKQAITLMAFVLTVAPVFAQGPGFATGVDDGCEIPLDGGLSLLAAAGIGYGIKKFRDSRKQAIEQA